MPNPLVLDNRDLSLGPCLPPPNLPQLHCRRGRTVNFVAKPRSERTSRHIDLNRLLRAADVCPAKFRYRQCPSHIVFQIERKYHKARAHRARGHIVNYRVEWSGKPKRIAQFAEIALRRSLAVESPGRVTPTAHPNHQIVLDEIIPFITERRHKPCAINFKYNIVLDQPKVRVM